MLVFISISTYRNLDRDKKKAMEALHRQGLSILHALEAGARFALSANMEKGSLESLFNETAKSEDIAFICLTDINGATVLVSDKNPHLKIAPWSSSLKTAPEEVMTRVRKISSGLKLYELSKRFLPDFPGNRLETGENKATRFGMFELGHLNIVLGLKVTEFEKAHAADMRHAFIMAGIMIALGLAALFFISVIQNYYLVDKTLKRTQDYTRQVVANMANGLLSINLDGEVLTYNQLALELLDLKEEKIKGCDLRTVIDFKSTGISKTLSQCRSVIEHEMIFQRKSGRAIPLSLSVTPIATDKETCSGAVILLRDLSEIKRLEDKVRRSEKLAAIGELAAGVAHEIRNPLSSIKGFAQFLSHALKERPEEREYAYIMVREIDRINRVVSDLLTYARPVTLDQTLVNLPGLIQHTIKLMTGDAQAKNVSITPLLSDDLKDARLDANQITQALLNLLLNALQAIPVGGEIKIGADRQEVDNQLHIWVEDNGPGIPKDLHGKVLDPFFTTHDKGTGLGLAIVHKIVENHQGEIHIQSPVEGAIAGTRISLYIPIITGIKKEEV